MAIKLSEVGLALCVLGSAKETTERLLAEKLRTHAALWVTIIELRASLAKQDTQINELMRGVCDE